MRKLDVRKNVVKIAQNVEHSWLLVWFVTCVTADNGRPKSESCYPRSRTIIDWIGNPVQVQFGVQMNDFRFCWIVRNDSLFLTHYLMGTNVWLPNNVPPELGIFKISREVIVLKQSQSSSFCSITYMTILFVFTCLMNRRLSQTLVHFVIDRASLFTDHRISGRPILVRNKYFRTIWEYVFDNSPTDFVSSSLKWWTSMHGVDTL